MNYLMIKELMENALKVCLDDYSLKAMPLRATALTAGRDFRRQGRRVGDYVL